jgi:hypothetical protein
MLDSTGEVENALRPWGKYHAIRQLAGGHRNSVWLVRLTDHLYVAKSTLRSEAAMRWLTAVHHRAEEAGFVIPHLVSTQDGRLVAGGVTLEGWVEGRPA